MLLALLLQLAGMFCNFSVESAHVLLQVRNRILQVFRGAGVRYLHRQQFLLMLLPASLQLYGCLILQAL